VGEGEDDEGGAVWRRADGRPLTPFELTVYRRAGLSPAEALEWADAGFAPYQTEQLREAGADLETAQRVRRLGLDHRHLRYARERNETLEAAGAAHAAGFDTALVNRARRLGLDDGTIALLGTPSVLRQAICLRDLGVTTSRILEWHEADLDLQECRWDVEAGVSEEDVQVTIAWHHAFKQPATRRAWRATGLDAVAAKYAAARGYRPIDALEGSVEEGCAPRTHRREVVLSDVSPYVRTADGTPLPPQIEAAMTGGQYAAVLRAFGYCVQQETPRTRFIKGHVDAIIIAFAAGRGSGVAAISSSDQGARLSILMPRREAPVGSDHANTEDAMAALAAIAGPDDLRITSVKSARCDSTELLRLSQPLAAHLDERARLNGLPVLTVEADDRCWVLPVRPETWPRHSASPDGEVAGVGTLFFTTLGPVPVGWFDDPAVGLAAARGRVPLLMVERTNRDQRTATTSLLRSAGGLLVINHRGKLRRLGDGDLLAAIRGVDDLRDVRADEATAFFVSSKGPAVEQLTSLLRLRQTALLATEEPVEFPESHETDTSSDTPVDEGLSKRAVLINGSRWVAIPPGPGVRPRLLPCASTDEWSLRPRFLEEWASFSCIEENSLVSGTSSWALGLLDDDLIGEWEQPDEDTRGWLIRRRRKRQEDEVATWILSLTSEMGGLDLPMLAAETRIGDLDGYRVPASSFDDDASDTLMCDLWVAGDTEALLRALRRRGRGDAIDAIRRPRSEAATRRRRRRSAAAE